jgi:hypothetical protein
VLHGFEVMHSQFQAKSIIQKLIFLFALLKPHNNKYIKNHQQLGPIWIGLLFSL